MAMNDDRQTSCRRPDYVERLVEEMDEETRQRIEQGQYLKLLEEVLPPKPHPARRARRLYAISAIARGRVCAGIVASFKEIKGSEVLDFGCGDGGFAAAFAQAGARVTAMDESESRVRRAKALAQDFGLNIEVRRDREFGETLGAGSFDIIICNDVIEHVDSFPRIAQSHARLLKEDGILFINPPNRFSLRNLMSDPHHRLFGVSLLNRQAARFWVTKVRKKSEDYTVNRLLGYREVNRIYARAGIKLDCYSEARIRRRLEARDFSSSLVRALVSIFPAWMLTPLIKYCVLGEWIFIGRLHR
jgi:2-polyprenyl-3-methyl-5-hydroxy-6-metoxy-1,4-benzoquinol methylase